MSILEQIFAHKQAEVEAQKQERPLAALRAEAEAAPRPVDFIAALRVNGSRRAVRRSAPGVLTGAPSDHTPFDYAQGTGAQEAGSPNFPALIAEIKRGSPSRGLLVEAFDPLRLAQVYAENGAAAISVLTDQHYFGGSLGDLQAVAAQQRMATATRHPLLRKDFLFDPYQLYQARVAGADAVLLIAAALEPACLKDLQALSAELGLAALVEVHTEAELETALAVGPRLIGINNRDLHTFTVNLETTLRLRPLVPAEVTVVAESGIRTAAQACRFGTAGVDAILVGEALVAAPDPAAKARELAGILLEA